MSQGAATFGITHLVSAEASRASIPGLAPSESHHCTRDPPHPFLWHRLPVYPGELLCIPRAPPRACFPVSSAHPLSARRCCLCLVLRPLQGRAWPCGIECKGFLRGEQGVGPGSMGDRSLGLVRGRGQGSSPQASVHQLRGTVVALSVLLLTLTPQDALFLSVPQP